MGALMQQLADAAMLKNVNTKHYRIGQPFHIHRTEEGKLWACSSPYCETITGVNPPEDGGPAVIQKGEEPWRGR